MNRVINRTYAKDNVWTATLPTIGKIAIRPKYTTPYHLETFFNYRVNDNISITYGVSWLFNPERFSANDTAVVGVLRTQ